MIHKFFAAALLAATVFAQSKPLTQEDRHRIIHQVMQATGSGPDVHVLVTDPTPSQEFPGYDTVTATVTGADTKKLEFLITHDHSKLMYVRSFDLSEDPFERVMRSIDMKGRPVRGTPGAPVSIVVFDDYQCPFCARFYITLFNLVMNQYRGKAQVVLKDFPIGELHPWAMSAAIAANCTAKQSPDAYWKFTDFVHTHQDESTERFGKSPADAFAQIAIQQGGSLVNSEKLLACVHEGNRAEIDKSLAEGRALGASATPSIYINGVMYEGALTEAVLKRAIEYALAELPKDAGKGK